MLTEIKPTVRTFATLTPHGLPTLPPTPTRTPTITPLTPAIQGTPAPIPVEIIRPENIQRLVAYARLGAWINHAGSLVTVRGPIRCSHYDRNLFL